MRTMIRKRTPDYREAFELIQKEAVPGGHAWSITYVKSDKEYVATVIKTYEEEKSNDNTNTKAN